MNIGNVQYSTQKLTKNSQRNKILLPGKFIMFCIFHSSYSHALGQTCAL